MEKQCKQFKTQFKMHLIPRNYNKVKSAKKISQQQNILSFYYILSSIKSQVSKQHGHL